MVVVFDTNILISARLSVKGSPFACLALAKEGRVESLTCEEILEEFREKLLYKFDYSVARASEAVDEVRKLSRVVAITNTLTAVPRDPDDNMVIECAVAGGATHIVSGDKRHLLALGHYQDIAIVSATEFLALVSTSTNS